VKLVLELSIDLLAHSFRGGFTSEIQSGSIDCLGKLHCVSYTDWRTILGCQYVVCRMHVAVFCCLYGLDSTPWIVVLLSEIEVVSPKVADVVDVVVIHHRLVQ